MKQSTKEDTAKVALVIAESLEEALNYCPSPALCREFAMRVLVEAKSLNHPLDPDTWVMAGYARTLEQMHKESLSEQED